MQTKWRVFDLAVSQLLFGCEWEPGQVLERADILRTKPYLVEFMTVEGRVLIIICQLFPQFSFLQFLNLLQRHCLNACIEIARIRHAILLKDSKRENIHVKFAASREASGTLRQDGSHCSDPLL